MSATHDRAARRERQAASVLGTTRVRRRRHERAPDVPPLVLASGIEVQAEVKSRRRLPYVVTRALAQAEGYRPGAVPLAVVFEYGRAGGLAIVRLVDFARIAGLDVNLLPAPTPLPRPRVEQSAQLTLPGVA